MRQSTTAGLDPTPAPKDLASMVAVLEARHGYHAAAIADFYSTWHDVKGDAGRSWAWAGVAAIVRRRERDRLSTN